MFSRMLIFSVAAIVTAALMAQCGSKPSLAPGSMLDSGVIEFDTSALHLKLVRSSQTVAALQPKASPSFDFTPADRLVERSRNGYYHLGDLDLSLCTAAGPWTGYSTALARKPVEPMPSSAPVVVSKSSCPLTFLLHFRPTSRCASFALGSPRKGPSCSGSN